MRSTSRSNLVLIINLRWLAIIGQTSIIFFTQYGLGISLNLGALFCLIGLLITGNLLSIFIKKRRERISSYHFFFQLLFDITIFTAILFVSGGSSNPFTGLYMIQVILAATLLSWRFCWVIVALSISGYLIVSKWSSNLTMGHHHHNHQSQFMDLHMQGMIVSYAVSAILVTYFVVKIANNLRSERDYTANLEKILERESTLNKLGLISAGAAHEMNTPLSTLTMATDELKTIQNDQERLDMIDTIDRQVARCRHSLNHILSTVSSIKSIDKNNFLLHTYLRKMLNSWRNSKPETSFSFSHSINSDILVKENPLFDMLLYNLCDNASTASSKIKVTAKIELKSLIINVKNYGPGIPETVATYINSPNLETTFPGMGLYLSKTIINKLNGSITYMRNNDETVIKLDIPTLSLTKECN